MLTTFFVNAILSVTRIVVTMQNKVVNGGKEMNTSENCKGYRLVEITKRTAKKEAFWEDVKAFPNAHRMKEQILSVLRSGGKVYGMKKKKEWIAVMLFNMEEKSRHDFEEVKEQDEKLGMSLEKWPKGLRKVKIFQYAGEYSIEGHEHAAEWFHKEVTEQFRSMIGFGNCYMVCMKEDVISLQEIEKEYLGLEAGGLGLGLCIGLIFGFLSGHLLLGIGLGVLYSVVFGNVFACTKKEDAVL